MIERLIESLSQKRFVILAGAGCSTKSGIPDYRGMGRPILPRKVMTRQLFDSGAPARQRYWARACLGWPKFASARPNAAHVCMAQLERSGRILGVITQNVDGLHHAAGSQRVIELHGTLHWVVCRACGARIDRQAMQTRIHHLNASWGPLSGQCLSIETAPDGDSELQEHWISSFVVPDCDRCGGPWAPDVVMFGDTVPAVRVELAKRWVRESDALLVLGSSLAVFSGYRFVRFAKELGRPVYIINRGPTRADEAAALRLDMDVGDALQHFFRSQH